MRTAVTLAAITYIVNTVGKDVPLLMEYIFMGVCFVAVVQDIKELTK